MLFDFKEMNREKVLMANNTQCNIKGIGKIRIINSKRKEVVLTEVRYMPSMSRNLISYGMLERAGCTYKGEGFRIDFFKGSEKVSSGNYVDGLYHLQGSVVKAEQMLEELNRI